MARVPVGRAFGPYMVDDVLGTGATGTVYAAFRSDGDRIALKVLSGFAMGNVEMRRAIHREFWAMRRLDHPNVPAVHRMGTIADVLYIEMELVDGRTLSSTLEGAKSLPLGEAVSLGASVARTLQACHDRGIVHRDVKPSNILVGNEREPVVFDFGLAQNASDPDAVAGRIYGTPGYLSPEQVLAQGLVDGRADLYSLGATLFRAITGVPPFTGERLDLLRGHAEEEPPRPSELASVPESLEAVVLRAMRKDPDERFESGVRMAEALEAIAVDDEADAGPGGTGSRWWGRRRKS